MSEFSQPDAQFGVAKFGGESMLHMEHVRERLEEDPSRRIAVVSALGKLGVEATVDMPEHIHREKVTDQLIAYRASGDDELLEDILDQHRFEAQRLEIFDTEDELEMLLESFRTEIATAFDEDRGNDIEIMGEVMSASLLAAYMDAEFIDPRDVILFREDTTGSAAEDIDLELTAAALSERMSDPTAKYIIGGYGGSRNGETVLLSRSGTDVVGAAVAVASGASRYEVFKEVDGIFSADPRKVEDAQQIRIMTYDEARDYGVAGTEALHKDVIGLLWDKNDRSIYRNIDTIVRHTQKPENPGTLITADRTSSSDELIIGLTSRDDYVYAKMHEYGMNERAGYGRDVLDFIAQYGVSVAAALDERNGRQLGFEHMPTGSDSLTLVLDKAQFWQYDEGVESPDDTHFDFDEFKAALNQAFNRRIERTGEIGSVHLIGQQHGNPEKLTHIMHRVSGAFIDHEIGLRGSISQLDSTSSVYFVANNRRKAALRAVHEAFFSTAR